MANDTFARALSLALLIAGCKEDFHDVAQPEEALPARSVAPLLWRPADALAGARSHHAAATLSDDRVVVTGGLGVCCPRAPLSSVEIYDPSGNAWNTASPMAAARSRHSATTLANGTMLVAGGLGANNNALASAERYNPTTGMWSAAGNLTTARANHTTTLLQNGQALAVGGINVLILASAEVYNPTLNAWTTTLPMGTPRNLHAATRLPDGRVLVTGGYDGNAVLSSAEIYNPALSSWAPAAAMSVPRQLHTSTLLSDGRVLVIGGSNDSAQLESAEIYDPASNTWTAAAPMIESRYEHTATLLPSGNVVVVGGQTPLRRRAEVYDPSTNGWRRAGCLGTARYRHTASLLPSGEVLVVGGVENDALSTVELHDPAGGSALGAACGSDCDCDSGFCTDGVCCDARCGESCAACDLAGSTGTCSTVPAGDPGDPVCAPYLCSGSDPECPTECTEDADCIPTHYCAAGACVPKRDLGEPCTAANECLSDICADGVCCDAPCEGACAACDLLGLAGTCTLLPAGGTGTPSCEPYACTGTDPECPTSCTTEAECAAGRYCDGQACVPKKPNGEECTSNRECTSGSCADGFCCDTACDQACDACDVPGLEGTCTLSAAGEPGEPSCDPYLCTGSFPMCPNFCLNDSGCVSSHFCSDENLCVPRRPNGEDCERKRQCESDSCADGVCCDGACSEPCARCNVIDLVGTCTTAPAGDLGNPECVPYVCTGTTTECPSGCTGDADCAPGHECDAGFCVPREPDGVPCTSAEDCFSGLCVDGVCCNSGCSGPCEACNVPGSEGTCSPAPVGTPGDPSCAPYVCSGESRECPASCATHSECVGSHYCDGGFCVPRAPDGSACTSPAECESGSCADGFCCDRPCSGGCEACNLPGSEGTCSPLPAGTECGGFMCSGEAGECPASCSTDEDCAPGFLCEDGTCQELGKRGYMGWSCASVRGDGASWWLLALLFLCVRPRRRRIALHALPLLLLPALAEANDAEPRPPVEANVVDGDAGSPLLDIHISAAVFGEIVSKQIGAEIGASYSVLSWLDLGVLATLGDRVGMRVHALLHPFQLDFFSPFLQLRAVVHPVREGVGWGGGAWLGGAFEAGPGRFRLGAVGEIYGGPESYHPFAVVAMAGYEIDPFRPLVQVRVEEKRIVEERVVEVPVPAPLPTTGFFRGRITDLDEKPLRGKLTLTDEAGRTRELEASPDFEIELDPGKYQAVGSAPGYLAKGRNFELRAGETVISQFELRMIPVVPAAKLTEERIEIHQKIEFEFNKAVLLTESYAILDEVVDILLEHKHLRVRIEGHTDDVGTPEYNLTLSKARAVAVMEYLMGAGIHRSRMMPEGYGMTRPLAPNDSDEGRARNRRVQFEIVSPSGPPAR